MKRTKHGVKKKISKTALLSRLGVTLLLLAICAVMLVIGRGHTVYFDNKTLEYQGQTYPALQKITIYQKDEKLTSLAKRERGMTTVIGQNCKVSLEIVREKGDQPEKMDVAFQLPYQFDGLLINLPGYLADLPRDAYMEELIIKEEVKEEEEQGAEQLPGEESFPGNE